MGDVAVVEAGGADILLTAERNNLFTPSLFTRHGIDIGKKRLLCIKSLYRYYDVFRPLVSEILLVATPGACNPNWATLPLTRVPRPIWPRDNAASA